MPAPAQRIIAEDLQRITAAPLPWATLAGKTVLVTGAAGFLPAYLVRTLLYLNDEGNGVPIQVVGLVRNLDKAKTRFAEFVGRSDLRFLVQDVAQPVALEGPVDFIIHAASQASPKYYGRDPVGTLSANTLGTANLLELARRKQAQSFLYFSSSEVYGQVPAQEIPTPETGRGYLDPATVRACYAEGKRAGETMCVAWAAQHQVPVRIVRPFHTYGPGMSLDDGRVFADFVRDIVAGRDIVMTSDGAARRAFCYLADATIAFFTVLLQGEIATPYNVGNPDAEVSILELAERLVALYPDKRLRVVRQAPASTTNYLASSVSRNAPDIARIRQLGWRPTTGIEEGFARTIRSFP